MKEKSVLSRKKKSSLSFLSDEAKGNRLRRERAWGEKKCGVPRGAERPYRKENKSLT